MKEPWLDAETVGSRYSAKVAGHDYAHHGWYFRVLRQSDRKWLVQVKWGRKAGSHVLSEGEEVVRAGREAPATPRAKATFEMVEEDGAGEGPAAVPAQGPGRGQGHQDAGLTLADYAPVREEAWDLVQMQRAQAARQWLTNNERTRRWKDAP